MKDLFTMALKNGIAFYPCSGFDFEMIHTLRNLQSRTSNFVYCNSENADGGSLNIEQFVPQIKVNGFDYQEIETILIEEIYPISCLYNKLGLIYGIEYQSYIEQIPNTVTHYKLSYDKAEYNVFYFRAEALTLFHWLNNLNPPIKKTKNNTLIIKSPNGQWIDTESFILLLFEQSTIFKPAFIYNDYQVPPYSLQPR
jgi:hypothetical protein